MQWPCNGLTSSRTTSDIIPQTSAIVKLNPLTMNRYTFRFQIGFFDTEIKEGLTMREAKDYALYRAKISGDGKCFVHGYN